MVLTIARSIRDDQEAMIDGKRFMASKGWCDKFFLRNKPLFIEMSNEKLMHMALKKF